LTNWHILGDLFSKTHLVTLLSTLGYDIWTRFSNCYSISILWVP
jgi:hypothetical protein